MRITQKVREHLRFLEQNGRLTPDRVVADAKRDESPLHPYFTWDVAKAAHQHWLDQARELIRTVKVNVTVNDVQLKTCYYIPDPSRTSKEQGYTSVDTLREDPNAAKQSLLAECERAAGVLRRARLIAVSLNMEDQIDTLLAHVAGMRQSLENGDGASSIS